MWRQDIHQNIFWPRYENIFNHLEISLVLSGVWTSWCFEISDYLRNIALWATSRPPHWSVPRILDSDWLRGQETRWHGSQTSSISRHWCHHLNFLYTFWALSWQYDKLIPIPKLNKNPLSFWVCAFIKLVAANALWHKVQIIPVIPQIWSWYFRYVVLTTFYYRVHIVFISLLLSGIGLSPYGNIFISAFMLEVVLSKISNNNI